MAATQNSPPLDLLGEIWGGGLVLLQEEERIAMFKQEIQMVLTHLLYVHIYILKNLVLYSPMILIIAGYNRL